MTINHILTCRDNKHSYFDHHYEKEFEELNDEVTCFQKSVANLRKDLSIQMNLDKIGRI